MTVGKNILKLMQEREMTMEEVAKEAGICYITLSNACRDSVNPELITIVKIAKALNVKPEELCSGVSNGNEILLSQDVASKVEKLRIERAMSKESLWLEAGISSSALNNVYKGKKYKDTTIIKIAKALGVDVQELDPSIKK